MGILEGNLTGGGGPSWKGSLSTAARLPPPQQGPCFWEEEQLLFVVIRLYLIR